jgi:spermidine/putrescine transport system substrate-binding protein
MKQILQRVCMLCWLVVSPVTWAEQVVLTFFNWPDYIDPGVLRQFERETGIRIHEVNYQSDDLKDDLLVETGGEGFDVVTSSNWSMSNYQRKGWLLPCDPALVPNARHIAPWVNDMSGSLTGITIPYLWGTMGIGWRKDKVSVPVRHWKDLLQPDPAFHGKILMFNDASEMVAMALKALGIQASASDPQSLARAEALLMAQKPYVARYGYDDLSEKSALVTGELLMAPLFNGDALTLQELQPEIGFVLPEEGGWLWLDQLAVLKASRHPKEAMAFVNFMHRPDIAAQNSRYLRFATTNASAWKLLPKSVLDNPLIYPPEKVRDNSELLGNLSNDQVARRNSIAAKVLD